MQGLVFSLVVLGGVFLAVLAERLGRRIVRKRGTLKKFYFRLCRIAPHDPCPCGRSASWVRAYRECCRPQDLESLEQEVRRVIWTDWMRRSTGRSRTRPMKLRLEDYPMAEFNLPDWVTRPEDHSFPIDEMRIRTWTPLSNPTGSSRAEQANAEPCGDLPL